MKIGSDEKLVFTLLAEHPNLSKANLQLLFSFVTKKKRDTGKIMRSLKIKELIDEKNKPTQRSPELMTDIKIDKEILDNINGLEEFVKLGRPAKSILYALSQMKKSSLQFMTDLLEESARNTYAVLQRLEEKGLVYSYNSKIYHLNARGRRFSPKYYVITDLGRVVAKIKAGGSPDHKKIDAFLQNTSDEIKSMHKVFGAAKRVGVLLLCYVANLAVSESFIF